MKTCFSDLTIFSGLGNNPLPFYLRSCMRISMCEETKTARLNSPAPSAHAAPRQTYAAPWHVQRGQTVAEAWVAEPALRRAYPGPVATLVRTRLWEDEEDTERKTGGLGVGVTIKTECKEMNQKRKWQVFVVVLFCPAECGRLTARAARRTSLLLAL